MRLIEALGKDKVHAFFDAKDIEVGRNITEEVLASIRRCNEFVVLLSTHSNGRPWVQFEIGVARGRQKPVIAILHNLNPQEMPDMLYTQKSVDLNDFEIEYLEQLKKRLLKWQS